MAKDYPTWAENCPFTSNTYREELKEKLNSIISINPPWHERELDRITFILSLYLKERTATQQRNKIPSNDATRSLLIDLINNNINLSQKNLEYIQYEYPTIILNHLIGDEEFQEKYKLLQDSTERTQRAIIDKTEEQLNELKNKQEIVENLKTSLEQQIEGYNFVGLSKGFENLLQKKLKAQFLARSLLTFLGVIIVMPALTVSAALINIKIPLIGNYINNLNTMNFSWEKSIPIAGLELILIYFFRVILFELKSIQTQIMQLELRQSLCQFIQSYVEHTKKMLVSGDDRSHYTLDKFENLIFSNILSSADKIPGTFDGVEVLTSMLKEIKK